MDHIVLDSAKEKKCGICGKIAKHKVEEVIHAFDKLGQEVRHPFTQYLCCYCFSNVMGMLAGQVCGYANLKKR